MWAFQLLSVINKHWLILLVYSKEQGLTQFYYFQNPSIRFVDNNQNVLAPTKLVYVGLVINIYKGSC